MVDSKNILSRNFNVFSLLRFALPSIITMVFIGLYSLVDVIFVSKFVNTDALSAINISCPVINIIVGLGTMIATGGGALVGRNMGEGNNLMAMRIFTFVVLVGFIVGLFITILGEVFIDKIIWLLGANETLYPYCRDYLFFIILFAPACLLQVVFQNFVITAGRPMLGMGLSIAAGIVNILLDYVFIVSLDMGISGSALGTSIGFLVPTIIGTVFFSCKGRNVLHFSRPIFDLKILGESCFNGSSEMVGQMALAFTTFLFNLNMMRIAGEDGVAAITIVIYSYFLLSTVYIGFSMGVAPVFSYSYGERAYIKLNRLFQICISLIGLFSLVTFFLSYLCRSSLIGAFSHEGTEVFALAYEGFLLFSVSFLFCGLNIFASASFTALSKGKESALISFLRSFVFLVASLLFLPLFLGVWGVWMAVPLSEFFTFILSSILIFKYNVKYKHIGYFEFVE